jgi:hypothetical protein
VKQVWAGLVALATGLVLLMVVYYLSTRSAEARTFIDRAIKEWRRWK